MRKWIAVLALFTILAMAGGAAMAGVSVSKNTKDARMRALFTPIAQTIDTRTLSHPGAAMYATNKMDIQWANAITYSIDNVLYTKAAGNFDISTLGSFDTQAASTARYYVFTLDSSGNVGVTSGVSVAAASEPSWPEVAAGKCPFAGVKVVTGATTFVVGTTAFDAANVTATWYNLSQLPSRALDE